MTIKVLIKIVPSPIKIKTSAKERPVVVRMLSNSWGAFSIRSAPANSPLTFNGKKYFHLRILRESSSLSITKNFSPLNVLANSSSLISDCVSEDHRSPSLLRTVISVSEMLLSSIIVLLSVCPSSPVASVFPIS